MFYIVALVRGSGANIDESDNNIIADLDNLDVQDFLLRDCQASSRVCELLMLQMFISSVVLL